MGSARVYVGNLDPHITERELEDEFNRYGALRSVWIARKPPGFAFVEFEVQRDAEDAVRKLDGSNGGWRVEFSRSSGRGGGPDGGGFGRGGPPGDRRCYECGEPGHIARDCRMRGGGGRGGGFDRGGDRDRGYDRRSPRRSRSPPPRRRSPSYERSRSPPRRRRSRSRS